MKYIIDIYLEEWDYTERKFIGITNLYSALLESAIEPQIAEDELYRRMFSDAGDGFKLQSYIQEDFAFIRLVYLWKRDYQPVFDYLKENFHEIPKREMALPFLNLDSDIHLQIDISEKENHELLFEIINEYPSIQIIKTKEIYEKGATGWEEAYLISMAAGFSIEILNRLIKYIKATKKERQYFFNDTSSKANELRLNDELKDAVCKLANESINNLFLSSFSWRQDKKVDMVFKSRYKLIFITCDDKMNILEYQVKELTQTRI